MTTKYNAGADFEELMGDPSAVGDDLVWMMHYQDGSKPEDLNLTPEEKKDYERFIREQEAKK